MQLCFIDNAYDNNSQSILSIYVFRAIYQNLDQNKKF